MGVVACTFEQSGLPDQGKLKDAFALAVSNYEIYTNKYAFEGVLRQVRVLHCHCPELSAEFLSSVLLAYVIAKESLSGDHPKHSLLPSFDDMVRDFGEDVMVRALDVRHVWFIPAEVCGVIWKTSEELKTLDTDMKKVLMGDMISQAGQLADGRVDSYGHPKPDYDFHTKILDGYDEAFKVVSGLVSAMDQDFTNLMPKARAAVESFRI